MGRYTLRQWVEHAIPPYRLLGNRVMLKKKKQEGKAGRQAGR